MNETQRLLHDAMAMSIGKLWLCKAISEDDKVRMSQSTSDAYHDALTAAVRAHNFIQEEEGENGC